jgi:hypothetical protein
VAEIEGPQSGEVEFLKGGEAGLIDGQDPELEITAVLHQ